MSPAKSTNTTDKIRPYRQARIKDDSLKQVMPLLRERRGNNITSPTMFIQ